MFSKWQSYPLRHCHLGRLVVGASCHGSQLSYLRGCKQLTVGARFLRKMSQDQLSRQASCQTYLWGCWQLTEGSLFCKEDVTWPVVTTSQLSVVFTGQLTKGSRFCQEDVAWPVVMEPIVAIQRKSFSIKVCIGGSYFFPRQKFGLASKNQLIKRLKRLFKRKSLKRFFGTKKQSSFFSW